MSLRTVNTETPRIGAASSTERRRGVPRPSGRWICRSCVMNGLDASASSGYTSSAYFYIPTKERSDGGIDGTAAAGGRSHRAGLVGGLRAQLATRTVPYRDGAQG